MNFITNLNIYIKFLLRNKLYTLVSVLGFSLSLTFVILLGVYVKQELSVDKFHEKTDRIFLFSSGDSWCSSANPVGNYIMSRCPEVESFTRLVSLPGLFEKQANEKYFADLLFVDSTFFNIFSYPLLEGDRNVALRTEFDVILSQTFARKYFGNESPMGKNIMIDGFEYLVTGVAADFGNNTWLSNHDLIMNYRRVNNYWTMVEDNISSLDWWNNASFYTILLAKEGTDIHAKSELLLNDFKKDYWVYQHDSTTIVDFIPFADLHFRFPSVSLLNTHGTSKKQIYIYLTISLIVLVVSIVNYVNMTVAQSTKRAKESAIKRLLGSSRGDIIVQLLSESFILMFITFVLGALFAFVIEPMFNNVMSVQLHLAQHFSAVVILFCVGFVVAMSFITGIIPAIIVSQFKPIEIVKGLFKRRLTSSYSVVLIIFQYTVSIVLIICTIVVSRQTDNLLNYDLGFDSSYVYTVSNRMDRSKVETFKSELLAMAGVENVSLSRGTPVNGGNNRSFSYHGESQSFEHLQIDSAFLGLYGISLEPNGVVPTYDTYWLNKVAFNILQPNASTNEVLLDDQNEPMLIAGVINDFHVKTLRHSLTPLQLQLLRPQSSVSNVSIKLNANAQPYQLAKRVDSLYTSISGGIPCEGAFVDSVIQSGYEDEAKISYILGAFTILTLIITIMGVFAMSVYQVEEKSKEIGIRKVNGATVSQILVMLNLRSFRRALIAFAIACPISYYCMSEWLQSYAYRISLSPLIFIFSGFIVMVLTLLSVSVMTWRAACANPIDILKGE